MANTLNFEDIAVLLNAIQSQATGVTGILAANTKDFVAQATTTLLAGDEKVMEAISQVLSRTIFAVRPYNEKFSSLRADSIMWGNHVRKINYIDGDFENDQSLPLNDGSSIDQYVINKPKVLQTNYYGGQRFQRKFTTHERNLRTAFRGPDEFAAFWSGVVQNIQDQRKQAFETLSRGAVANFMAAKTIVDSDNVIHLVPEYNEYAGTSFTVEQIKQPANFPNFAKWMYGRIKTLTQLMSERSKKFHLNIGNDNIMRHTPITNLRAYLYTNDLNMIDAQVLSDVYHDNYLRLATHESVNFWQSIESPDSINVLPSYTNPTTGAVVNGTNAVELDGILGLLFDEEAIGVTEIFRSMRNSPYNAAGEYYNTFYHWTLRYWNDLTENAILLLWE